MCVFGASSAPAVSGEGIERRGGEGERGGWAPCTLFPVLGTASVGVMAEGVVEEDVMVVVAEGVVVVVMEMVLGGRLICKRTGRVLSL